MWNVLIREGTVAVAKYASPYKHHDACPMTTSKIANPFALSINGLYPPPQQHLCQSAKGVLNTRKFLRISFYILYIDFFTNLEAIGYTCHEVDSL